jgi:hypothetical protein
MSSKTIVLSQPITISPEFENHFGKTWSERAQFFHLLSGQLEVSEGMTERTNKLLNIAHYCDEIDSGPGLINVRVKE